jgi:hypothetical protein
MCLGPAAGVRLVGTLSLLRSRHLFLETVRARSPSPDSGRNLNSKEEVPNSKTQIPRSVASGGQPAENLCLSSRFARGGICNLGLGIADATVASPGIAEPGRTRAANAFGFSPKFSTTVENAVENPGVPRSSTEKCALLQGFYRGETRERARWRVFAADSTATLTAIARVAEAKVTIS